MEPLRRRFPMGGAGGRADDPTEPPPAPPRHDAATIPGAAAAGMEAVRVAVVEALRQVQDPELPVDIVELGLLYRLDVDPAGAVAIEMTLTAPGCPVAQTFPGIVEETVRRVDGVGGARVTLVWEPPWCTDRMSEVARLVVDTM